MGCKEALRLSGRPEAADDLLPSPRRPVAAFDPVVEAFVGPRIGTLCLMCDRLGVAAQLVGDDDPWRQCRKLFWVSCGSALEQCLALRRSRQAGQNGD